MTTYLPGQTSKEARAAGQALHQLLDGNRTHIRAADRDAQVYVHILGTAQELHGPAGCCVCCHGGDPKRAARLVRDGTHR